MELPIDRNLIAAKSRNFRLLARTKTLRILRDMLLNVAWTFDMQYLVTHIGTDGYHYLLMQRQMILLVAQFGVITVFTSFLENIVFHKGDYEWISARLNATFLENTKINDYRPYFNVVSVLLYSLLAIRNITQTRKMAKESFKLVRPQNELLKAQTLHVRGLPPEDRTGAGLKRQLEKLL